MTITFSGSTITQANEAAKPISGVTSITGGIRLNVLGHGYSVGNAVRITDRADYLGRWIVSSIISADLFTITSQSYDAEGLQPLVHLSSAGGGSVARGDSSPAGLSSIAGVTTWTLSGGARPITYYSIPSTLRLVITGLLRIPLGHIVVVQGSAGSNGRVHLAGGDLLIDKRFNRFGGSSFSNQAAIICAGQLGTGGDSWANPPQCYLHLETGEITQWGGTIVVPGSIRVNASIGAVRIRSGVWDGDLNSAGVNDYPVWFVTCNLLPWDVDGLDLIRGKFEFSASNPTATKFKNVRLIASNRGFSTGAPMSNSDWFDLYGVKSVDSSSAIALYLRKRLRLYNSARVPVTQNDTVAGDGGLLEHRHRLNVTLTDVAGVAQAGAKLYVSDDNSGVRRNWTETTPQGTYVNDLTYSATADGVGACAIELLVFVTQVIGPNVSTQWFDDNRFTGNAATLRCVAYRTLVTYRTHDTSKGTDTGDNFVYSIPMLADTMVTEANSATVADYTYIDTAVKLYDRLKLWFVETFAGQVIPFSRNEDTVTIEGLSLAIIKSTSGATPAFSVSGTMISIKVESSFAGSVVAETVQTINDATVLGLYTSTADGTTSSFVTINSIPAGAAVLVRNGETVDYVPSHPGGTYTISIPPGGVAGSATEQIYTWVVNKAGYTFQYGTFDVDAGGFYESTVRLVQKLTPSGSPMYTGLTISTVTVTYTDTTVAHIDIGDMSVTPQVIFNAVEQAGQTEAGLIWLIERDEINLVELPSGKNLFLSGGWRLRRASAGDGNAAVLGYVFSTDGTPLDDTNGAVAYLVNNTAAELAAAVWGSSSRTINAMSTSLVNQLTTAISQSLSNPNFPKENGGFLWAMGEWLWNTSISAIPELVWEAASRTLTANPGATKEQIAAQVRTNLATELARIDAAVSSREAEAAAANRHTALVTEHDATQAALAALPSASTTAAAVWAAVSRTLTSETGATKEQIAAQVRVELAAELARMDANVSSRAAPGAAMTLTSGERATLAGVIEAALLNDGDGTALVQALVNAIGNVNVDQAAVVAAVQAALERVGGMLDGVREFAERIPSNPAQAGEYSSTLAALGTAVAGKASQASVNALPSASANASAVQAALASTLAGLETETAAASRAAAQIAEHDATQAAIAGLPTPPTTTQIRAQVDAALTSYDAVVPGDIAGLATGAAMAAGITAVREDVAAKPSLVQIEASTVLAKESTASAARDAAEAGL